MARMRANTNQMHFDAIDRAILSELQENSKITNAMLAERVGISPPSTLERVKKLEKLGVIQGYAALLDPELLNQPVVAIVHVSIREHTAKMLDNAKRRFAEFDEVQACWYCAGDEDFILKVRVEDMDHFERFVSTRLATVEGIGKLRTSLVLRTLKDTPRISLASIDDSTKNEK